MANNPKNLDNLKPFEKGNQASKGFGRPPGKSITSRLQEMMDGELTLPNKETGKLETKDGSDWFALRGFRQALSGDFRYWKEIKDTLEGKPLQKIESETKVAMDFSTMTDEQLNKTIERFKQDE